MPKTIGDYTSDIWTNYFAKTRSKKSKSTKSKVPTKKPQVSNEAEENNQQGYRKLSPYKRRLIAEESPLLMKGIKKKCADTFRAWFILEPFKTSGKLVQKDMDLFLDFELRSNYKGKLNEAKRASHIFGNGFLLIDFRDDEDVAIENSPRPTSEPWNVQVLNSEYLTKREYFNDTYKAQNILHFYYNDPDHEEMWIHPDRIQWIPANLIPGHNLGVSTIDLLRWTMFSKKNIDIAAGYILSWYSHGVIDLEILDMDDDQREYYEKLAAEHPGTWVHDQDLKVDIKPASAIDPRPFYDYVVLNIAAALNMPTHVLTGIQMGRVTGAEIGFADYYRDVTDDQELEMTPLIRNLYSRILKSKGKKWKYNIIWNPIYIDEMAEAKLLDIKITAAQKAKDAGLIDLEEGRTMINKGQIELDPTKEIKQPITPKPLIPGKPIKPPMPGVKKEQSFKIVGGLGEEERQMINRCKEARAAVVNKRANDEKKLGKKILDEQDDG